MWWLDVSVPNERSIITIREMKNIRIFYESLSATLSGPLLPFFLFKNMHRIYCSVSASSTVSMAKLLMQQVPIVLSETEFPEWKWIARWGSVRFKSHIYVQDESSGVSVRAGYHHSFAKFSFLTSLI